MHPLACFSEKIPSKWISMVSVVLLLAFSFSSCSWPIGKQSTDTFESKTLFAMDTIILLEASGEEASYALVAAENTIRAYETMFSCTSATGDVAMINNATEENPAEISHYTYNLIYQAMELSEKTDGAFDPTLGAVSTLWGFSTASTDESITISEAEHSTETISDLRVPDDDDIAAAQETVGIEHIHMSANEDIWLDPCTILDLGGIAKGYIADLVIESMQNYDVTAIMINLGGNIRTWGAKASGDPFVIGIQDPSCSDALIGTIDLTGEGSVITSGNYERYFEEDGVRYGHIMDGETGRPVDTDLLSVSIINEEGATGDALSTALFAMGEARAVTYALENNLSVILVNEENEIHITSDLQDVFQGEENRDVRIINEAT